MRGLQSGVRRAFSRTVGGNKIFQHVQPLFVGREDGKLNRAPGGISDQPFHPAHLGDLRPRPARCRSNHGMDRPFLVQHLRHQFVNSSFNIGPEGNNFVVAFLVRQKPFVILFLDRFRLSRGRVQNPLFIAGNFKVVQAPGNPGARRVGEPESLDLVQNRRHLVPPVFHNQARNYFFKRFFADILVNKFKIGGQNGVEQKPPHGSLHHPALKFLIFGRQRGAHFYFCLQINCAEIVRQNGVVGIGKIFALARSARPDFGQPIRAHHHILRRRDDRGARAGLQKIFHGSHNFPSLPLRLLGQRHMHSHLVSVKIRVEGLADQGMNLNGVALDQNRLKSLNPQAVQSRRAVQ